AALLEDGCSPVLHVLQPLDPARLEARVGGVLLGGLLGLRLADFAVRLLLTLRHDVLQSGRHAPLTRIHALPGARAENRPDPRAATRELEKALSYRPRPVACPAR